MRTAVINGSREITAADKARIDQALATVEADRFITGAAYGVDSYAMNQLIELFPDKEHVIIVPSGWHSAEYKQHEGKSNVTIVHMPPTSGHAFRERNQAMIDQADVLYSFPEKNEKDAPRSGTWMTVRMARKAGVEVHITVLKQAGNGFAI